MNQTFPDNVRARAGIWLPHLEALGADDRTILIGHSSGAVAALRYAETHRLLGSVLVAVCHTDLGDPGERASGYYRAPWRWADIRAHQQWIGIFQSVDDPHIPVAEARFVAAQLGASYFEIADRGHFVDRGPFRGARAVRAAQARRRARGVRMRRPRYPGRNPRAFHQKYKELQPESYAGDVQKVLQSGKTPAGMHRPIMVDAVLDALAPQPGAVAVDCTLGVRRPCPRAAPRLLPGGRLIGLDVDPLELPRTESRLRDAGFAADVFTVHRTNFAGLPQVLAAEGLTGVDLVLADLGVSSMQLDDPARGFTFKEDAPLDMRMNPSRGQPASALLARLEASALAALLEEHADEPHAAAIAGAVAGQPLATTRALADLVRRTVIGVRPRSSRAEADTSVRRTFQALRIAVNDELAALDVLLRSLPGCLAPGGRVAILTFHSGEDRRVKKAFQHGRLDGVYASAADEVVRASVEEVRDNPRSAAAKLRWAVRAR